MPSAVLASVHMELKQIFPKLIAIFAPRHPERGKEIGMVTFILHRLWLYKSDCCNAGIIGFIN